MTKKIPKWLKTYEHLVGSTEWPELAAITSGSLRLPLVDAEVPFNPYCAFPPALLPLWSSGLPSFYGIWKHWFVSRATTIVEVDVEQQLRATEIARRPDQLYAVICRRALSTGTARRDPTLRAFSEKTGADLSAISDLRSDNPTKLRELPAFRPDAPLICFSGSRTKAAPAGYTGDFPASASASRGDMARWCGHELSPEGRTVAAEDPNAPPWLAASGDQADVFRSLLKQGKWGEAWLSLNSPTWEYEEAKDCIRALSRAVKDKEFKALADAWCAIPTE